MTLKYFNGFGAVNIIESSVEAQLLEYIGSKSLASLAQYGRDDEAMDIICEVVEKLHLKRDVHRPNELTPLRARFLKLLEAKDNAQLKSKLPHLNLAIHWSEEILSVESENIVLHGDIHHENILYSPQRGWLAIDPKGLYGHRAFDLLNSFYNPLNTQDLLLSEDRILRMTHKFCDHFHHEPSFLMKFAFCYGYLSSVWSLEDGFNPGETVAIAKAIKKVHDEAGQ